jgi:anti-anti-sigma regulatory factor
MRGSTNRNLIVENTARGVRVMRFVRPELWQYLDEAGEAANSPLFREVEHTVLADLPAGWTVVANLALVDIIGAAFYRCLLHLRKCVQERRGRLVLCGLTAWHREVFELFRGPEVFAIVATEADAVRSFRDGLNAQETRRSRGSRRSRSEAHQVSQGDGASESFECAAA